MDKVTICSPKVACGNTGWGPIIWLKEGGPGVGFSARVGMWIMRITDYKSCSAVWFLCGMMCLNGYFFFTIYNKNHFNWGPFTLVLLVSRSRPYQCHPLLLKWAVLIATYFHHGTGTLVTVLPLWLVRKDHMPYLGVLLWTLPSDELALGPRNPGVEAGEIWETAKGKERYGDGPIGNGEVTGSLQQISLLIY